MYARLIRNFIAVATINSILIALIFVPVAPLFAEEPFNNSEYPDCCQGNQGNADRDNRDRNYSRSDLSKIETLDGKVINLGSYPSQTGTFKIIHLLIKTAKETIEVHSAPSWYLREQDFVITPQDEIIIKGSRISIDGKPVIVAREIRKGDRTLLLRDKNGVPMWRMGKP